MVTSKEKIARERAKKAEYKEMREQLFQIKADPEATAADKIAAINLIMKIDEMYTGGFYEKA
jgi:hypothetical protein